MAAIIGQKFGKHCYEVLGVKKSWEGSLTMMGVSFLVTSIILSWVSVPILTVVIVSLMIAIVAMALEAFSKLGIDNLTVPLGSAFVAFYLINQLSFHSYQLTNQLLILSRMKVLLLVSKLFLKEVELLPVGLFKDKSFST